MARAHDEHADADRSRTIIEPATADDRRTLWDRLSDQSVTMFTTFDAEGRLGARPIKPMKVESDGHLWFFTANDGGLAADIRRNAAVHLSFIDPAQNLFVSLSGEAQVLRDPQKAREMWSTLGGAWFPGGPDDANLALVRVDVHQGDYWDVKESKLVRFFRLTTSALAHERPKDVGVHRRFTQ